MPFNKKLAVFIVLMAVTVFVWIPRGKKLNGVSASTTSDIVEQDVPVLNTVSRERTKYTDWGRDPFASSMKEEEKQEGISGMELTGIVWSNGHGMAFINNSILHPGDKIAGKTVTKIDNNRVILTDGTKNYTLILHE